MLGVSLATTLFLTGCASAGALSKPDAPPQRVEAASCDALGSKAISVKEWVVEGYLDPPEDTSKSLQHAIDSASKSGGAIVQLPEASSPWNVLWLSRAMYPSGGESGQPPC